MTAADPKFRFGPFVIQERTLDVEERAVLDCDIALIVPSWENRAEAWTRVLALGAERLTYLDFDVEGLRNEVLEAQIGTARKWGATPIVLRASVQIEVNRKTLLDNFRSWSAQGSRTLFIDITSLPKAYIQFLVCSIFSEGLFARLIIGYAEGRYEPPSDSEALETAIDFGSANIMSGGVSPCREKHLVVVLGGERANCYALIEKMTPDALRVLATRSMDHPEQAVGIETQIEKLKTVYADRLECVREVDAFSVRSFLDAVNPDRLRAGAQATTSVFAAGTKPHALASAILASSVPGVDLRYRRAGAYRPTPVDWAGRYHLYDVIDLRSPALALCPPW